MADAGSRLDEASRQYVKTEAWDQETRQKLLQTIVSLISQQPSLLQDMVASLEDVLTDTSNPTGRKHAVRLIGDCLASEDSKLALNFKHVETFANFFLSKLTDWQCVEGAVAGLVALFKKNGSQLRELQDEDGRPLAAGIARRVFKEVHTPSHTQVVRNSVLVLAISLLTDWHVEMEELGEALGEGVVAAIEEERDPRNLVLSFRLAQKLLEDFGDSSCVMPKDLESLFEALTSYFPITFTPPKDDKVGITGEDLRHGLASSLGASSRMADFVVPFLLDASKDISSGDSDDTIKQALELNAVCLERYGPDIAKKYVKDILTTAQDQVCRTTTPCPVEFADFLRRSLAVVLRDVPLGLHPSWLSRLADPVLKPMAQEAAMGQASLASSGSRRLMLATAAAHPVLLEHTWLLTMSLLLPKPENEGDPQPSLEQSALPFLLNFLRLAEGRTGPLLRPRQLTPALTASLVVLQNLQPGNALSHSDDGDARSIFAVAVELIGRLCKLAGEGSSQEAFLALRLALSPSTDGAGSAFASWSAGWHAELSAAPAGDARMEVLVDAIAGIAGKQPARAGDLAPALAQAATLLQLPPMLPRLISVTAFSLARCAAGDESGDSAAADVSANTLLKLAADLIMRPELATDVAHSLADALTQATGCWAASRLCEAMKLPAELPRFCDLMGVVSLGEAQAAPKLRTEAFCRLIRALAAKLPEPDAVAIRARVLDLASGTDKRSCLSLVPAALPEAAQEDWALCLRVLPAVQACVTDVQHAALEAPALEALQALVESCPPSEVDGLLGQLRDTFGPVLTAGHCSDAQVIRATARCWAVVAGALLRRGGFASQAAAFLEVLLSALEKGGPVACHVPLAFQALMPPQFDSSAPAAKLPPIALQQLSRTTLPSLLARAKASAGSGGDAESAALESAVSLLSALPAEVACTDCSDDLRWCVLTGLKAASKSASATRALNGSSANARPLFAAQIVQLLVRAMRKGASWVEDDLHSVVPPLMDVSSHCIPLVRLACFQALSLLIREAHGHLTPFKKIIEKATKRGVEDRRREVRLVAVECLNFWYCGRVDD